MDTVVEYGRVRLRPTARGDIENLVAFEQDPANAPFIRLWTPAQHEAGIANPNIGHFVVQETESGETLGHVILVGIQSDDHNLEFKRIVIMSKGKGLGRDTVRAIKKYTFETLGFHRLWLEVLETNVRAKALYASEGFVEEGVHREAMRQGDRFLSLIVMAMLAGEYAPQ